MGLGYEYNRSILRLNSKNFSLSHFLNVGSINIKLLSQSNEKHEKENMY